MLKKSRKLFLLTGMVLFAGIAYFPIQNAQTPAQNITASSATVQSNPNQPRQAAVDLESSLEELNKLPDAQQKADKTDLCPTTISFPTTGFPAAHSICVGNKEIPRRDMPQLSGIPRDNSIATKLIEFKVLVRNPIWHGVDLSEDFIKYLKNNNIVVSPPQLKNIADLRATQKDLIRKKVLSIWKALKSNPNWSAELVARCNGSQIPDSTKGIIEPIFISRDNYIVDGHHRWTALTAAYQTLKKTNPNVNPLICVRKIEMDILPLIQEARSYAKVLGIPQEAGVA